MLKALIASWRNNRAERALYAEFVEMLEMAWEVFETTSRVLAGQIEPDTVMDDVLVQDISINRKERAIRRQLVEHMTLGESAAVPSGLILMSITKDAERLGDYCKNLMEVALLMQTPAKDLRYAKDIVDIGQQVTGNYQTTLTAFRQSDEDLARDIIDDETLLNRRCDGLIERIANSDLDANEAVSSALWVRFLKRINAHLSNICSSLVLPVHRIDYRLTYEKEKSALGRAEPEGNGDA